jgi:hypothetical protein
MPFRLMDPFSITKVPNCAGETEPEFPAAIKFLFVNTDSRGIYVALVQYAHPAGHS